MDRADGTGRGDTSSPPGDAQPRQPRPPHARFDAFEDVVTAVRRAEHPVFVRFSRGPECDLGQPYSRDYESGLAMSGLSATGVDPPQWWTLPLEDWVARKLCDYRHLADREPDRAGWLLTGRVAGRGPDDEPLLADVEPLGVIGRAALVEAERRYETRMDRGRDSVDGAAREGSSPDDPSARRDDG